MSTTAPTADLAAHKQLAQNFLSRAFALQVDDALTLLHPQATWWVLGNPDQLRAAGSRQGPQIERMLRALNRSLPQGMTHEVLGITAEGARVAVEVAAEGTFVDGRSYRNRYHFLFVVRDGLIGEIREYMDTLCAYEASQPATNS